MKRVLLTSAGLTDSLWTFFFSLVDKPAENLRVLFIPTAAANGDDEAREGSALCIAELLRMGIAEENIFPYHINYIFSDGYDRPYLSNVPPLYRRMTANELLQFDLVLVGGGNAGFLMEELCRTGLDAPLKEAVEGGLFYLGVSAGSMVAAGNFQEGLHWVVNPIFPHSAVGTPCGALPKDDAIFLTNEQAVWLCGDTAQILK